MRFRLAEDNLGEVTLARDGYQAMQLLREQDFDLVMTDIHMPYHNGEEIIDLIRVEQTKNIPIIMFSSDVEEEVIAMAKRKGVNEFMRKPAKPNEVSQLVRRLLKL